MSGFSLHLITALAPAKKPVRRHKQNQWVQDSFFSIWVLSICRTKLKRAVFTVALQRVDVVKPHDAQENMFISSLSETLQGAENIWFATFELCSTPLYFISTVFIFPSSVCLACAHVGVMEAAAVKVVPRDWQQFSTSFSHKPLSAQRPDRSWRLVITPSSRAGQFRRRRTRSGSSSLSTSSDDLRCSSQEQHFTHDSAADSQAL